jgi:protocatechuate 3,4-dioxygenase beta subunit
VSLRSRLLAEDSPCPLLPERTEGPYHRAVHPEREDITEGHPGVALQLALRLLDADGTPLAGAVVDVWQADAGGRYSGFPPMPVKDDDAPLLAEDVPDDVVAPQETFLRGSQRTDTEGVCAFTTIWPGWYSGRTVHVHASVRLPDGRSANTQLYFPDEFNDIVLARPEYGDDRGARDTTNATDSIYADGGEASTLRLERDGAGWAAWLCLLVARAEKSG